MTDGTASADSQPYDWDRHEDIMADLLVLESMEGAIRKDRLSGNHMFRRLVMRGPYGDNPPEPTGTTSIDGRLLVEHIPQTHARLSKLVREHIRLSRARAASAVDQFDALLSTFPEEKFRPQMARMAEAAISQVADMKDRVGALSPILKSGFTDLADPGPFDQANHRLMELQTIFRDCSGYSDPVPVSVRLEPFCQSCDLFSKVVLEHVEVQRDLSETCLARLATNLVLTETFGVVSTLPAGDFKAVLSSALAGAQIDLDFASNIRRAIYTMTESSVPYFPSAPYVC